MVNMNIFLTAFLLYIQLFTLVSVAVSFIRVKINFKTEIIVRSIFHRILL